MDLLVKALREFYSFAICLFRLKKSTNKKSVDTTHTLWGVRRPRHLQDRCLRRSVEQSTLFQCLHLSNFQSRNNSLLLKFSVCLAFFTGSVKVIKKTALSVTYRKAAKETVELLRVNYLDQPSSTNHPHQPCCKNYRMVKVLGDPQA